MLTTLLTLSTVFLLLLSVMFLQNRKRDGLSPLQIAEKNKPRSQEIGDKITPASLAAKLIATFGMLFILASFYPSDTPVSWRVRFTMAGMGVGLILLAVWLVKPRPRPRYWWATVWGMACGACWVIMFVCAVIVVHTPGPRERVPQWVWATMALVMIVGSLGAILSIWYGVSALIGPESDEKNPAVNPPR